MKQEIWTSAVADAAIRRQGHTGATSNAAPPMHPVGPAASGHVPTCYSGSCTPSSSHPTTTSTAAAIPQQQLQPPPSPSLSYEHNMRAAAFHGGGQQRMHAARPQRIPEGENGRPSSMINGHEVSGFFYETNLDISVLHSVG